MPRKSETKRPPRRSTRQSGRTRSTKGQQGRQKPETQTRSNEENMDTDMGEE